MVRFSHGNLAHKMNRWLLYPHLVLPPLGAPPPPPPPPVVNEEKDPDEGEEEDETPRMLYQGSAEQVPTKTRRRRTEARAAGISISFIMLLLLLLRRWSHIFFSRQQHSRTPPASFLHAPS